MNNQWLLPLWLCMCLLLLLLLELVVAVTVPVCHCFFSDLACLSFRASDHRVEYSCILARPHDHTLRAGPVLRALLSSIPSYSIIFCCCHHTISSLRGTPGGPRRTAALISLALHGGTELGPSEPCAAWARAAPLDRLLLWVPCPSRLGGLGDLVLVLVSDPHGQLRLRSGRAHRPDSGQLHALPDLCNVAAWPAVPSLRSMAGSIMHA